MISTEGSFSTNIGMKFCPIKPVAPVITILIVVELLMRRGT
jgi:hypothetical protein